MKPMKKIRLENRPVDEGVEIAELNNKINLLDSLNPNDVTNFNEFPISQLTLRGLSETDFIEPTKVQRQTLVHSLSGKDVVAASKTGSGKSLAFIIPMLEILYRNRWSSDDGIGALVITPTRELAYQLFELLNIVGKHHSFSAGLIIGGKDLKYEWEKVGMLNIIICTPGRILQHITENSVFYVDNLQILILDEADECLSMGFEKPMKTIFRSLPKNRQTLLFSATQTKNICELSMAGCKDAVMCFTHQNSKSITPKKLVEAYYVCRLEDKMAFLWTFINDHSCEKLLVFVTTCKQAKYYSDLFAILKRKLNILQLHGGMHQLRRMAVYDNFCTLNNAVMIATDVAARGLDFPNVHWVIQLDCPENAKVYIHRVGRTARFDDEGRTVLIVTPMQKDFILPELTSHNIKIQEVEEYPSTFANIRQKIENELARNIELREQAERTFYCYLKALTKTRKELCDLANIDFDAYARSLGLIRTPNLGFIKKKLASLKNSNEMTSPEFEPLNYYKEENELKDVSVDGFFPSDQPMEELSSIMPKTQYPISKNINKTDIKANTKIIFDDDVSPVMDECSPVESNMKDSAEVMDYLYFLNKIKAEGGIDRKVNSSIRREKKDNKRKYSNIEVKME